MLRFAGWRLHRVQDACLFDHSPSPQRCARDGGVWDDTWAATVERGGACITAEEAARRLAAGRADLEAVDVNLSSDGRLSDFLPKGLTAPDTIRCLTPAASAQWGACSLQQRLHAAHAAEAPMCSKGGMSVACPSCSAEHRLGMLRV